MTGFVAPALIFNIGTVELVEEEGDAPLDEEVGDQLHEDGGQDQLQVLLQPAKLFLYRGFHSERSLTPGGLSIELKIKKYFLTPLTPVYAGNISAQRRTRPAHSFDARVLLEHSSDFRCSFPFHLILIFHDCRHCSPRHPEKYQEEEDI